MSPKIKNLAIQVLRRASYRSPARNEALKKARISRGLYVCNSCGHEFKRREVQVDHIKSVVSELGFQNFDEYINNLFCDVNNLQVLCKPCHRVKSQTENKKRRKK